MEKTRRFALKIVFLAVILGWAVYVRAYSIIPALLAVAVASSLVKLWGMRKTKAYEDERLWSVYNRSARNGFVAMMFTIAFLVIYAEGTGAVWPVSTTIMPVFALGTISYLGSYAYYKQKGD
ncbi:MAG: DUF2178 domain-containing protein [Candidatus Diapherotrites archaeon]|nr:DUF2178 domain-containing protein [Candidatus Diapherotrites archaeon]